MSKAFRHGAVHGWTVWGAYAAGEIGTATVLFLVLGSRDVVSTVVWEFTFLLLAIYLVAGALLGGLASMTLAPAIARFRRGHDGRPVEARIAVLTLILAYLANILSGLEASNRDHLVALFTGLGLLAVTMANLLRPARFRAVQALSTPWLSVALLLGIPLLAHDSRPHYVAVLLLALALLWVVNTKVLGAARGGFRARQALSVGLAIPAVLVATVVVEEEAPPLEANLGGHFAAAKCPNVLFVVLDTVRADHLSVYGYERRTTPWMENFAGEATVYTRASAVSNFTLPAHASMFTGLYPRSHGAICFPPGRSYGLPLAARYQTMAEILSGRGYLTMGVVANVAYVNPEFGLDQGFEVFDARWPVQCLPDRGDHYLRRGMRRLLNHYRSTGQYDRRTRRAEKITDEALNLLEGASRQRRPFFLFLNYMDAHEPYVPPAPYDTLFPGKNREITYERYLEIVDEVFGRGEPMTEEERAHLVSQYDGGIAYLDSQMQRLVERLKELGRYGNTLIVITSDHGEAFGEHNFVGHLQSLEEHQLRIPLLIRRPRQPAGERVERLVSQVDLLPTILDAAGIAAPNHVQGRSLLQPEAEGRDVTFAESYIDGDIRRLRPDYPERELAVLSGNLRLISQSNGEIQVFDLAADPGENHNLYRPEEERARELLAQLDRWLESMPLQVEATAELDPKTLERLKALGYVR
jgi:arylsulfatase A-like enzyme